MTVHPRNHHRGSPKAPTEAEGEEVATEFSILHSASYYHQLWQGAEAQVASLTRQLAEALAALKYYADPNYNGHNGGPECAQRALAQTAAMGTTKEV